MRRIGLHLRLNTSLTDVVEKALRLKLSFFQCFLVLQGTGKLAQLDPEDVRRFLKLRRENFTDLYMHGSYWINLAGTRFVQHYSLDREIALAKKLEFTHIVLHPGSAKGAKSKFEGIDAMARALNQTLRTEHDIKIVIENTAYGDLSVGGDLQDFKMLLDKLEHPEKIVFCIDTAHAHSYGYDLTTHASREAFVQELEATIGIDKIALLHLNDTCEKRGSRSDRHAIIGRGLLGDEVLKQFALHPKLIHIPMLMELPVMSEEDEQAMLKKVTDWHSMQGE